MILHTNGLPMLQRLLLEWLSLNSQQDATKMLVSSTRII